MRALPELVLVAVLPAHGVLDELVQGYQGGVGGDLDPPPDGRRAADEIDADPEGLRRQHGEETVARSARVNPK